MIFGQDELLIRRELNESKARWHSKQRALEAQAALRDQERWHRVAEAAMDLARCEAAARAAVAREQACVYDRSPTDCVAADVRRRGRASALHAHAQNAPQCKLLATLAGLGFGSDSPGVRTQGSPPHAPVGSPQHPRPEQPENNSEAGSPRRSLHPRPEQSKDIGPGDPSEAGSSRRILHPRPEQSEDNRPTDPSETPGLAALLASAGCRCAAVYVVPGFDAFRSFLTARRAVGVERADGGQADPAVDLLAVCSVKEAVRRVGAGDVVVLCPGEHSVAETLRVRGVSLRVVGLVGHVVHGPDRDPLFTVEGAGGGGGCFFESVAVACGRPRPPGRAPDPNGGYKRAGLPPSAPAGLGKRDARTVSPSDCGIFCLQPSARVTMDRVVVTAPRRTVVTAAGGSFLCVRHASFDAAAGVAAAAAAGAGTSELVVEHSVFRNCAVAVLSEGPPTTSSSAAARGPSSCSRGGSPNPGPRPSQCASSERSATPRPQLDPDEYVPSTLVVHGNTFVSCEYGLVARSQRGAAADVFLYFSRGSAAGEHRACPPVSPPPERPRLHFGLKGDGCKGAVGCTPSCDAAFCSLPLSSDPSGCRASGAVSVYTQYVDQFFGSSRVSNRYFPHGTAADVWLPQATAERPEEFPLGVTHCASQNTFLDCRSAISLERAQYFLLLGNTVHRCGPKRVIHGIALQYSSQIAVVACGVHGADVGLTLAESPDTLREPPPVFSTPTPEPVRFDESDEPSNPPLVEHIALLDRDEPEPQRSSNVSFVDAEPTRSFCTLTSSPTSLASLRSPDSLTLSPTHVKPKPCPPEPAPLSNHDIVISQCSFAETTTAVAFDSPEQARGGLCFAGCAFGSAALSFSFFASTGVPTTPRLIQLASCSFTGCQARAAIEVTSHPSLLPGDSPRLDIESCSVRNAKHDGLRFNVRGGNALDVSIRGLTVENIGGAGVVWEEALESASEGTHRAGSSLSGCTRSSGDGSGRVVCEREFPGRCLLEILGSSFGGVASAVVIRQCSRKPGTVMVHASDLDVRDARVAGVHVQYVHSSAGSRRPPSASGAGSHGDASPGVTVKGGTFQRCRAAVLVEKPFPASKTAAYRPWAVPTVVVEEATMTDCHAGCRVAGLSTSELLGMGVVSAAFVAKKEKQRASPATVSTTTVRDTQDTESGHVESERSSSRAVSRSSGKQRNQAEPEIAMEEDASWYPLRFRENSFEACGAAFELEDNGSVAVVGNTARSCRVGVSKTGAAAHLLVSGNRIDASSAAAIVVHSAQRSPLKPCLWIVDNAVSGSVLGIAITGVPVPTEVSRNRVADVSVGVRLPAGDGPTEAALVENAECYRSQIKDNRMQRVQTGVDVQDGGGCSTARSRDLLIAGNLFESCEAAVRVAAARVCTVPDYICVNANQVEDCDTGFILQSGTATFSDNRFTNCAKVGVRVLPLSAACLRRNVVTGGAVCVKATVRASMLGSFAPAEPQACRLNIEGNRFSPHGVAGVAVELVLDPARETCAASEDDEDSVRSSSLPSDSGENPAPSQDDRDGAVGDPVNVEVLAVVMSDNDVSCDGGTGVSLTVRQHGTAEARGGLRRSNREAPRRAHARRSSKTPLAAESPGLGSQPSQSPSPPPPIAAAAVDPGADDPPQTPTSGEEKPETPDLDGQGKAEAPDLDGQGEGEAPDLDGQGKGEAPDLDGQGEGEAPDLDGQGEGEAPELNGQGKPKAPDLNGQGKLEAPPSASWPPPGFVGAVLKLVFRANRFSGSATAAVDVDPAPAQRRRAAAADVAFDIEFAQNVFSAAAGAALVHRPCAAAGAPPTRVAVRGNSITGSCTAAIACVGPSARLRPASARSKLPFDMRGLLREPASRRNPRPCPPNGPPDAAQRGSTVSSRGSGLQFVTRNGAEATGAAPECVGCPKEVENHGLPGVADGGGAVAVGKHERATGGVQCERPPECDPEGSVFEASGNVIDGCAAGVVLLGIVGGRGITPCTEQNQGLSDPVLAESKRVGKEQSVVGGVLCDAAVSMPAPSLHRARLSYVVAGNRVRCTPFGVVLLQCYRQDRVPLHAADFSGDDEEERCAGAAPREEEGGGGFTDGSLDFVLVEGNRASGSDVAVLCVQSSAAVFGNVFAGCKRFAVEAFQSNVWAEQNEVRAGAINRADIALEQSSGCIANNILADAGLTLEQLPSLMLSDAGGHPVNEHSGNVAKLDESTTRRKSDELDREQAAPDIQEEHNAPAPSEAGVNETRGSQASSEAGADAAAKVLAGHGSDAGRDDASAGNARKGSGVGDDGGEKAAAVRKGASTASGGEDDAAAAAAGSPEGDPNGAHAAVAGGGRETPEDGRVHGEEARVNGSRTGRIDTPETEEVGPGLEGDGTAGLIEPGPEDAAFDPFPAAALLLKNCAELRVAGNTITSGRFFGVRATGASRGLSLHGNALSCHSAAELMLEHGACLLAVANTIDCSNAACRAVHVSTGASLTFRENAVTGQVHSVVPRVLVVGGCAALFEKNSFAGGKAAVLRFEGGGGASRVAGNKVAVAAGADPPFSTDEAAAPVFEMNEISAAVPPASAAYFDDDATDVSSEVPAYS
ncbi:hypothetical protein DIPPA_26151 [Diplonema papillatum]|nr:hypothetical protein DIPPA_26151 [Diplonema papillatum]